MLAGQDDAQIGVGTLLILVAGLLVAAIGAGVLINTTDLLEDQAVVATDEVSNQFNKLEVVAVSGEIRSGTIETVNVTVKQTSDDGGTDLRDAAVQWLGPAGAANAVWVGADESADATFGATLVRGAGTEPVLQDRSDRVTLTFDTGTVEKTVGGTAITDVGPALEPGDVVVLTFSGAEGDHRFRVPDPLPGRSSVAL
jgi:archaellin